ncbi:hypothetical protein [Acetobacter conturbans]|uniref:Transposase n=1 Tax=Acetobacter conturbans TaxID=1737472 RepID=A0ABX0K170_9PROT|nr:hypothetical protein [Acetobacter conturbans]NHN88420.1 hypothetical protein [Acetobacter conturbans]
MAGDVGHGDAEGKGKSAFVKWRQTTCAMSGARVLTCRCRSIVFNDEAGQSMVRMLRRQED